MARRPKIKKVLPDTGSLIEQLEYLGLFLALFVCLSLFLWNISSLVSRGYREERKFLAVQDDVMAQEAENEKLKQELEYAKSDISAEEGARDVLGMVSEGEELVFVDESLIKTGSEADTAFEEEPGDMQAETLRSYWQDWIFLFAKI